MVTTDFQIQTIDFKTTEAPSLFLKSLRETGFAVLKNHDISWNLVGGVLEEWKNFFESSYKGLYKVNLEKDHLGFYEFGSENAKGYQQKNLMEYYHYALEKDLPQGMSQQTILLFEKLLSLGKCLLGWLDQELPDFVVKEFPCPASEMMEARNYPNLLRIIHYPPLETEEARNRTLNSAHEDLNLITLLCGATAPGLQVKDVHGNWHSVGHDKEAIVVNVADCLEVVTRSYIKSTTHRVVCPAGFQGHRYSIPCSSETRCPWRCRGCR